MAVLGLAIFLVLLFGSCRRPVKRLAADSKTLAHQAKSLPSVKEIEAHLNDVPFPFTARFSNQLELTDNFTSGTFVVLAALPLAELLSFYEQEMGWLGWEQRGLVRSESFVFILFEKPHKRCFISLEAVGLETRVVIGIGPK